MELAWSEEDAAFRQELRDFLARELPDRWWSLVPGEEPASAFTFEFCRKLGEAGSSPRTGRRSTAVATRPAGSSSSSVRSCGGRASPAARST